MPTRPMPSKLLVTQGEYDVTKKLSMGAIELIKEYLPRAVENGQDIEAREAMLFSLEV